MYKLSAINSVLNDGVICPCPEAALCPKRVLVHSSVSLMLQ